ncbi:MAG: DUF5010 domain-containing protein [Pirellulales bacterium]|nr:DUF5010 domain-containing protein [Pirellulales bacterium]
MLHSASLLCVVAWALAAELPADYTLPPPPGEFVGPQKTEHSFPAGKPLVATSYFYWYHAPSGEHVVDHDGTDALTDHPKTLEGFSHKSVDWHAGELADMIAAGIDVAMPVYWGSPDERPLASLGFSDVGLPPLVAARERLIAQGKNPPRIGMFYDTSTLQHNRHGYHADLTTPAGRLWFHGTIRDFFSLVPPEHRACVDGRPLVFLYTRAFAKDVDDKLFPAVREMFRKDFGTDLFLVKMADWPGEADSVYQWGGALGPRILATAGIGPGYDHSAVPGRSPLVQPRLDGGFYRYAWEKLLAMDPAARPWLVHVETWNELHEGTEICETKEYGRLYIDLTRRYADRFRNGVRIEKPFVPPTPAVVSATPDESQGLKVVPQTDGDGPVVVAPVAGRPAWTTKPNRHSSDNRYMYFSVGPFFLAGGETDVEVTITYLDAGGGEFRFEYDSCDPALEGVARRFRVGHRQPLGDTGQWKEVTFRVPHAQLAGGTNGADFRLARVGADLSVARVRVKRIGSD